MDAGYRPIMTYGGPAITGGSHAPKESYSHRPTGPPLCRRHPPGPLKLGDYGPKCRASLLFTLLLYAAARITSLSDACKTLRNAPSDEIARLALIATLPDFAALQRRLNAALAGNLPRTLRRREQRLAADLVLIPYHGQPLHDPDEVYRSQAKSGPSHFHAY